MKACSKFAAGVFIACMVGAAVSAADHGAAKQPEDGWSYEVNGLKVRIVLKRKHVFNGTPIISTYLELRNLSDVMNPLTIPWDHKLIKFRVEDGKGIELKAASVPYSGPQLAGTVDLVLPIRGTLSFDYSLSGAGVASDKAAHLCLGSENTWVIEPGQGDFFLHAILEVKDTRQERGKSSIPSTIPWHGRIELPPVKIPLHGEPIDDAQTEARIEELGPKMLVKDYRVAEQAWEELSLLDDPRVIDWYVKLLSVDEYSAKFTALDRLSRFNDNRALEAIKKSIETEADDFGEDTASKEAAGGLAQNIRHSAASALARSPHPEAKPFLITMWKHPDRSVRITILHVLGKMDSPESLELLRKMSADPDKVVQNEAKRYLDSRAKTDNERPAAEG